MLVGVGRPLPSPGFALDGSEEPEIAGIYLMDAHGRPRRLGFCLANGFSNHVTERETRAGDVFEVEARPFRLPLRDPLARVGEDLTSVMPL